MYIVIGSHLCKSYSVRRPGIISDLIIKEHAFSINQRCELPLTSRWIRMSDFKSLPDFSKRLKKWRGVSHSGLSEGYQASTVPSVSRILSHSRSPAAKGEGAQHSTIGREGRSLVKRRVELKDRKEMARRFPRTSPKWLRR